VLSTTGAGVCSGPEKSVNERKHVDGHSEKLSFIWLVVDKLRSNYRASDYGKGTDPRANARLSQPFRGKRSSPGTEGGITASSQFAVRLQD
jgi:hypothetical protein